MKGYGKYARPYLSAFILGPCLMITEVLGEILLPKMIMSGTGNNTLPLAQLNFQTQFGTNYNLAFASYLLALLPILIFYLICQKQIIGGVASGAVK